MSANRKTEASEFDPETTIENIDEIKSDHMKNINYLETKIPAIVSNKPYSYSDHPNTYLIT